MCNDQWWIVCCVFQCFQFHGGTNDQYVSFDDRPIWNKWTILYIFWGWSKCWETRVSTNKLQITINDTDFFWFDRLLIPVFYVVLITICICGQTAISIRKCLEHCKDEGVANVQNAVNQNNQAINNQRWNHLLCSNSGTMTIILVLFFILISKYIQNWWILNHFKLNKVETMQYSLMFNTFVYCVGIPLAIYARNEKLYKHVKNEISDFLYG